MIKETIKKRIRFLTAPKEGFNQLKNTSLETSVAEYLKLMILLSIAAAAYIFISSMIRSAYLQAFFNLDINYWFMLNYLMGKVTSTMFFYFFAGTFILFFISLPLKLIMPKIRYVNMLQILFHSLTPILLFGWIPELTPSLLVWAIFLFTTGTKTYKDMRVSKNSIKNRD